MGPEGRRRGEQGVWLQGENDPEAEQAGGVAESEQISRWIGGLSEWAGNVGVSKEKNNH